MRSRRARARVCVHNIKVHTQSMDGVISEHLVALYGEADARDTLTKLEALVARSHPGLSTNTSPSSAKSEFSLTERDVLLITYADQVTENGQPPLRTLREFARRHLEGVVSGIHLLPFYPSSSDDGFSVKDYY